MNASISDPSGLVFLIFSDLHARFDLSSEGMMTSLDHATVLGTHLIQFSELTDHMKLFGISPSQREVQDQLTEDGTRSYTIKYRVGSGEFHIEWSVDISKNNGGCSVKLIVGEPDTSFKNYYVIVFMHSDQTSTVATGGLSLEQKKLLELFLSSSEFVRRNVHVNSQDREIERMSHQTSMIVITSLVDLYFDLVKGTVVVPNDHKTPPE